MSLFIMNRQIVHSPTTYTCTCIVHCRVKLYYDNCNSTEKIELQKDLKICPLSKSRMLISSMPRVNGVLCFILMSIHMFDNL